MRPTAEFSIELTAQELDLPQPAELIEIDDLGLVPTAGLTPTDNTALAIEDSIEIELTPDEIDALLEGTFQPR